MSTTDTEADWHLPPLKPEDDLGETGSQQRMFSKLPDMFLIGEYEDESLEKDFISGLTSGEKSEEKVSYGENVGEYISFIGYFGEAQEEMMGVEEEVEEEEEEEEDEEEELPATEKAKPKQEQEHRRRSLFVHSSPNNFADINRARKSVFGSIFVRATGYVAEEAALLKSIAENNFNNLQSMLNSLDQLMSSSSVNSEKRRTAVAYRESLMKSLEMHGMSRTYSDGSAHWDIYPITQNYLFSIQLGDHVHQTRHLSKIEDRIVNGTSQILKPLFVWPTKSSWEGHWNSLGMGGPGDYCMPHGVTYTGNMQDGMFQDDDGTLTFPNQFKALHCVYHKGVLQDCQFQFPDKLMHEKTNWGYCQFPDRRFWNEVLHGLKPAKIAQKTQLDPPRRIPPNHFDTSDGFYNPKTLMLLDHSGELLRVPACSEDIWIKKYCRKAVPDATNFRPDLYENWFDYDEELITSILRQQEKFRTGKISYEGLQQFYADHDLLLPYSDYKKRKTMSEIALEEYLNSIPQPVSLKIRSEKKYKGHCLFTERDVEEEITKKNASDSNHTSIKSFESVLQPRVSSAQQTPNKSSKISFRRKDGDGSAAGTDEEQKKSSRESHQRKVPEQFMRNQPILRIKPPFPQKPRFVKEKRPCAESFETSSDSSNYWELQPEGGTINVTSFWDKELKKFMKEIIMSIVTEILVKEREKHRERYKYAKKFPSGKKTKKSSEEMCFKVMQEIFASIPDREEYCDSYPDKMANFRKLAEDKYNTLKYWGQKFFTLSFEGGLSAEDKV